MKTLQEWPMANDIWGDWGSPMLLAASLMLDQTRFELEQELAKQHWLDMAHPLPKRKGAKQ